MGVAKENPYFFALPQAKHPIRGWDAIKRYIMKIKEELMHPEAITGTQLRKQVSSFFDHFLLLRNSLGLLLAAGLGF